MTHLRFFDDDDVNMERPYALCGVQGDVEMRNLMSLVTCSKCKDAATLL